MATKAKAAPIANPAAEQPAANQTHQATTEIPTTPIETGNTTPSTDTGSVTAAEVAGAGTGTAQPVLTHRIAATIERGFYRAGRHWPSVGVDVHRDEFSDEQWVALMSEPRLVVTEL